MLEIVYEIVVVNLIFDILAARNTKIRTCLSQIKPLENL